MFSMQSGYWFANFHEFDTNGEPICPAACNKFDAINLFITMNCKYFAGDR